jgi:hypothetical protein
MMVLPLLLLQQLPPQLRHDEEIQLANVGRIHTRRDLRHDFDIG